jgi:hypothetical protein
VVWAVDGCGPLSGEPFYELAMSQAADISVRKHITTSKKISPNQFYVDVRI